MGKNTILENKHSLDVQTIIIMFPETIKDIGVITFCAKGIYSFIETTCSE